MQTKSEQAEKAIVEVVHALDYHDPQVNVPPKMKVMREAFKAYEAKGGGK